jgi:hypothetical protein
MSTRSILKPQSEVPVDDISTDIAIAVPDESSMRVIVSS